MLNCGAVSRRRTMESEEQNQDTAQWDEFACRNRGQPLLEADFLYSLNKAIIDAIKIEVPGFFAPRQLAFELDLARTASLGFFYRRVYGRSNSEQSAALDKRQARSTQQIDEMLAEEFR